MNQIVREFKRDLPNDLALEQQLLGAILINNEAYERVSPILTAEMFYEDVHGRIYDAVGKAIKAGLVASPVTLKGVFQHDPALADVGGAGYLARLASASLGVVTCVDYAKILRDLHLRRRLIELADKVTAESSDPNALDAAKRIIAEAEQELFTLGAAIGEQRSAVGMDVVMDEVHEAAEAARKSPDGVSGISTGIKSIDRLTGGLMRAEYTVLGGRPSMGKTALAMNIARNVAKQGLGVFYVSPDMPRRSLGFRVASLTGYSTTTPVPYADALKGNFTEWQWQRFSMAMDHARTLPIMTDDQAGRTISAIRLGFRRAVEQWSKQGIEPGLLIIDHLGLVRAASTYRGQRVLEIGEISAGVREIAKEFNVPALALSQLNRTVEQRDDKRPIMSDLRESGNIEQDADTVFFVFREYYYAKDKPGVDPEWLASIENKATIIIAKQRQGPTRDIDLFFDAPHGLWSDLA